MANPSELQRQFEEGAIEVDEELLALIDDTYRRFPSGDWISYVPLLTNEIRRLRAEVERLRGIR